MLVHKEVDIVIDFPELYLEKEEWEYCDSILGEAGLKTSINLIQNNPYSNACFDNIMTLHPIAVNILLNAGLYPAIYDAICFTVKYIANRVRQKRGSYSSSDRMPHITMITEKGVLHVPVPCEINENADSYFDVIKQCVAAVAPDGNDRNVEYIFDIDDGYLHGEFKSFEEYGNKG